jgi:Right handed beta helix region/Secretion system C-terminal sorting domain
MTIDMIKTYQAASILREPSGSLLLQIFQLLYFMKTTPKFFQWIAMTLFLGVFANQTFSQPYHDTDFGVCQTQSAQQGLGGCTGFSPFGRVYTPQGRLHVLVVLMYDSQAGQPGHPAVSAGAAWPNTGALPTPFLPGVGTPGPGIQNVLFNEHPSTVSGNQYFHNLSEYFYTFSNPSNPFIVTGLVYPEMIDVSLPTAGGFQTVASTNAHKAALNYIASQHTAAWWDQFDLRTQSSNVYSLNNSTSGPDGKIDYIVFMQGSDYGQGVASTLVNYQIPGTNKTASFGHSFQTTPTGFDHFAVGFLHEYAHLNMAGAPHYSGANNAHGTTYNVQNFYGMMGGGGLGFYSPTAWEAWYNGWLNPANYIELHPTFTGSQTYELKDFTTQHAAMRIEIPNSAVGGNAPQYLWLENRKVQNYWDHKQLWTVPNVMDAMSSGVYAYVIKGEGGDQYSPCVDGNAGANLLKPISADGARDWESTGATLAGAFGVTLPVGIRLEDNPLSGGTYRTSFSYDFEGATPGSAPDGILKHSRFSGNSNSKPYDYYNKAAENINGTNTQHWKYTGNDDEAFHAGNEISLSGIMPAVNYQNYNDISNVYNGSTNETLDPIYLNGISVKFLGISAGGNELIKVAYNDYEVRNNKRWCGNIILPDFEPLNANEYLNIATGVELRIDQSKTPHRETINPATGTWVNPTVFDIKSGGKMHLDSYANVIVEHNSEMIVQSGGDVEIHDGAVLTVRTNGKLRLKGGSHVYVHDGGRIIIEPGATLEYEAGADITLNGFNSILEIAGNLEIGAGADFTFHNGTSPNAGFVRFNLPTIGNYAPNITCGVGSTITFTGANTSDLVMEVLNNSTVHPAGQLDKITVQTGLVKMGQNASLNTGNADIKLFRILVTAFQASAPHAGIFVNGQANHTIDRVEISHGKRGITATQFYNDGAMLRISNSNFHHCDQALVVYKKGAILSNCNLNQNTYGYIHYYPSFNSRAEGSNFNQNIQRGVHVFAAGGNLLLNHSNADYNGLHGVFFKGNGKLALTCASASYNGQAGIYAGHGSFVALDNSVNTNGAQSTIYKNNTSIWLNWAKELYLNKGRNEITSTVHSTRNDIKGFMMKNCPSGTSLSFAASKNHWNFRLGLCANAPADYLQDFNVQGYSGCGINFADQTPACAPLSCDESPNGGGGGNGITTPLESCSDCETINTTHFADEYLNKAVKTAIDNMTATNPTMSDLTALEMFSEILTYSYEALAPEELWLLDLAYSKMWETYASACESGDINTLEAANDPQPNDYTGMVLASVDAMQLRATFGMQTQSYEVDRAVAYSYVNCNATAIALLDALIPEVDNELKGFAALMKCQLAVEEDVQKGLLPVWEFESTIAACNAAFKMADFADAAPALRKQLSALVVQVYPNPSNGSFHLAVKQAAAGDGVARLYDVFGKEVGSQRLYIQPGQEEATLDFDVPTLPSGFYVYRFIDAAGHAASGELVIAK